VLVTSQEAIDSVVTVKGNDFSKIQGRFDTRLSLSSSSVDEVIKKRVLAKKPEAESLLKMVFDNQRATLKNLFTFTETKKDIKGYGDEREFIDSYPFVPYQFTIIQNVLAEIRKHGNSGKHLSGGERSMLSGFQEAVQKISEETESALVPFYRFYDTVSTFLESTIRRVIERCSVAAEKGNGMEKYDVSVLKLLYLIRYITDITPNAENIAILMVEAIDTDMIALKVKVHESLDRLESQNYISRSGDNYLFLTDEEQDIASDIRRTEVESVAIIERIAKIVYDDIYTNTKLKYKKIYDISFDKYIDGKLHGISGAGATLRIVTIAGDLSDVGEHDIFLRTASNGEAVVILSKDTACSYYSELEAAEKINRYANKKSGLMPDSIHTIISSRQQDAKLLFKKAKANIEKAIVGAKVYVSGTKLDIKASTAKEFLDEVLTALIDTVYTKLGYITKTLSNDDAEILSILRNGEQTSFMGGDNADATAELSQWLDDRANTYIPVTMEDIQKRYQAIPYGWREIDIAALVARLVVAKKVNIEYGGAVVGIGERRLADYLRKRTEIVKTKVVKRTEIDEETKKKAIGVLREYFGQMAFSEDEDTLIKEVAEKLETRKQEYADLLQREYVASQYPGDDVVRAARDILQNCLEKRRDGTGFLSGITQRKDRLLDSKEDMEEVAAFFRSQRTAFDTAWKLKNDISGERDYFATDTAVTDSIKRITEIIQNRKPYKNIQELPGLCQTVREAYDKLLTAKRAEVSDFITQCMNNVHTAIGENMRAKEESNRADGHYTAKKEDVKNATTLTVLDAMITQLESFTRSVCKSIEGIISVVSVSGQYQNGVSGNGVLTKKKYAVISRYTAFKPSVLHSESEIETYVQDIKERLTEALKGNDGVQIN
jgi:hypothetical protein